MILKYMSAKHWAAIAVCVVLVAVMVYLELEIPGYMTSITAQLTRMDTDMDVVLSDGGMMLACAFGSLAFFLFNQFVQLLVEGSCLLFFFAQYLLQFCTFGL